MIKLLQKHILLACILIFIILICFAVNHYPGGNQYNSYEVGFSMSHNYICNLFDKLAVNKMVNIGRPFGLTAMFFLTFSIALFFYDFSKKVSNKKHSIIIKVSGISSMIFALLIASPMHNSMIAIASIFGLIAFSYIVYYIYKSKLTIIKLLCFLCISSLMVCNISYYSRTMIDLLPIFQKIALVFTLLTMLMIHYGSKSEDFL